MKYSDLSSESIRYSVDAVQVWETLEDAKRQHGKYQGNMRWKMTGDKEYLVRDIRRGSQKSLGPRSQTTEMILAKFIEEKQAYIQRLKQLEDQLSIQAKICMAVMANRVPKIVADVMRKLSEVAVLQNSTMIVGTNALYAYEAAAGVRFVSGIVATRDVDVLWDSRREVKIAARIEPKGFLGLLQSIDNTFEPMGGKSTFRAANAKGFMVDLIQQMTKTAAYKSAPRISDFPDDLVAVEIKGLDWLVSCPKFKSVAIDDKGYPVELVVPDPRAFVMHKYWLSLQLDREPQKKQRDREQAEAVRSLVLDKLPYLSFSDKALMAMPKVVVGLSST